MAKRTKNPRPTAKAVRLNPKSTKSTSPYKHMSSEEFLKKAEKLWRAGPEVRYKYPDSWQRVFD